MREAFFSRRDTRVNALIGTGHFLSHFYALCLPPVFIAWQRAFGVSYAEGGMLHRSRRSSTGGGRPSEPADNRASYSPNA
ncbi:MAG TPA: hypothetical protein VM755_12050 [Stellaceae bacterium]|nr:hypothetical protein [Stellaceae bacterium]